MLRPIIPAMCLLIGSIGTVLAASPEFTADAVQSMPGQELRSGKIYVSKFGTRFEFQERGRPVVQITQSGTELTRVLFPLDRTYLEFKNTAPSIDAIDRPAAPCTPSPKLECTREGEDEFLGIKTERWSVKPKGAPRAIRVWWDKTRKMPLRQELLDGSVMQAIMRGKEKYENRDVENWEITYMSPNGRFARGMSLYAPDLGISIVEQHAGGAMRQLINIQKAVPDEKLFAIPEGYKKIDPQADAKARQKLHQGNRLNTPPQSGQTNAPGQPYQGRGSHGNMHHPGQGQMPNQGMTGQMPRSSSNSQMPGAYPGQGQHGSFASPQQYGTAPQGYVAQGTQGAQGTQRAQGAMPAPGSVNQQGTGTPGR